MKNNRNGQKRALAPQRRPAAYQYNISDRPLSMGKGRLSENSNGAKFSPTGDWKIEANSQCNSHFMAENSNKNGIKSHRTLVFGQSGG